MRDRNRLIMMLAMVLAIGAIAVDHARHRPPYVSETAMGGHGGEDETPCTMGLGHEEEDEEDEL